MEVLSSIIVLIELIIIIFLKNHSGWWVNTGWRERGTGFESSKLHGGWNSSVRQGLCLEPAWE